MADVSQTGGTFLDVLVDKVIPPEVVGFLNTTITRHPLFILNYWSFVHFGMGLLFGWLFPKRFKLWLKINIAFEVIEFLLALGGNPLFVEEAVDVVWDIALSMLGFLAIKLRRKKKNVKPSGGG